MRATAQVVVVNDDAAAGVDSKENDKMMDLLLDTLPCRLAGGFTTNERVYDWLDKGASQVIVEYAASNLGFLDGVPKVSDDAGFCLFARRCVEPVPPPASAAGSARLC